MQPEVNDGKSAWRAWAKSLATLNDSDAIVAGIRRFLTAQVITGCVLSYRPMPGEIDLDPLLSEYACAVTRTWPHGRLSVHAAEVAMERHRWGYFQPVADAPELSLEEVGVVLVPGLAFDRSGGRLGHGAGYYDRLLPHLQPGVMLIGVTSSATLVDQVPTETHDIPMTHLATEAGVQVVQR